MCLHEEVESVGEFGTVYNYPCVSCVFILSFSGFCFGKGLERI